MNLMIPEVDNSKIQQTLKTSKTVQHHILDQQQGGHSYKWN